MGAATFKGMTWHGHQLVSTGHPEDDQPWCRNCGLPADDDRALAECAKAPDLRPIVVAEDRPESEPCEAGTPGCCVAHARCDHGCETW